MAEFKVSVLLKADGKGLVNEAKNAKAAIDDLKTATTGAARAAKQAETASDAHAAAVKRDAEAIRDAATAQKSFGSALSGASASAAAAQKSFGGAFAGAGAAAAAAQKGFGAAFGAAVVGAKRSEGAVKLNALQLQNLQFQLQDIGIGLASGQSPFRVLAQQGSQIVQIFGAGTGVRGALKSVGAGIVTFLTNPLNIALLSVTALTGGVQLLAGAFLRGDDAAEKKKAAVDALKEATKALDEVTGRGRLTQEEQIRLDEVKAKSLVEETIKTRELLKARLELARGAFNPLIPGSSITSSKQFDALTKEIEVQNAAIAEGEASLRAAVATRIETGVEALLDPVRKARDDFERSAAALRKEFEKGVANGGIGEEEFAARLEALTRARDAEIEGLRKTTSSAREASGAHVEIEKATQSTADRIRELTEELDFERRLIGLTNEERAGEILLRNEQRRAAQAGIEITKEEAATILELGKARAALDDEVPGARDAQAAADEFTRIFETARESVQRTLADTFDELLAGRLNSVKSFWKSFAAIGRRQIAEELAEFAFNGGKIPAGSALGGIIDGVSSLFGGKKSSSGASAVDGVAGGVAGGVAQAAEIAGSVTKGVGGSLKSLFNKLGGSFDKILGKAFGGVQTASLLGVFGNKGQTGAQIGGAIGSFLPIPGGSIIGSIAGKILGGLFGGTPKSAAAISTSDGELDVTSSFGKGKGREDQAIALAGSVVSGLKSIAASLGGDLVDGLNLGSIGTRKKKFTFDPSGQNRTKGAGVQSFGSEAEAAAAAIRAALAKGAVEGLSDAVRRALASSKDVDKAVANALKVQDLERLIEGVTDPFRAAFRDFEAQAKERLKTARQFGFDVVEIEKINADERKRLVEAQLESVTGPVKRLLDELKFGGGAEGSIIDQRNALIAEQARLQAQVDGGDLSAIDNLAQISSQLIDVTKEAFGTTGAFADTRGSTTALLEQLLSDTETRIRASSEAAQQAAGTDKTAEQLGEANQSLDELVFNSQKSLNELTRIAGSLADGASGGGGGRSFAAEIFLRASARAF